MLTIYNESQAHSGGQPLGSDAHPPWASEAHRGRVFGQAYGITGGLGLNVEAECLIAAFIVCSHFSRCSNPG